MVLELIRADGVLLRRDAIAAGYDDKQLYRLVAAREIVRIRHGAYAATQTWSALDDGGRHGMLSSAVVRQYDDDIALSHGSAVLRLAGPVHGLDLANVHISHLDNRSGRRNVAGVVHHKGDTRVMDVTRLDGCWTTSPARTVIDVVLMYGFEVGVVVADDFLHRGLTTKAELWQLYEHMKHWPGALVVRLVIGFADGDSESVGESLGRLLFRRLGLPIPGASSSRYAVPMARWPAVRIGLGPSTALSASSTGWRSTPDGSALESPRLTPSYGRNGARTSFASSPGGLSSGSCGVTCSGSNRPLVACRSCSPEPREPDSGAETGGEAQKYLRRTSGFTG